MPEDEMTLPQILKLVNDAHAMRIKTVILTGGEPFLRDDIFDICKYCFKKGMQSFVNTNGTLLEDKIQQIIDSHIDYLQFSIDGLEQTHDYIRNRKGCFKKTINVIKEITDFKCRTGKGPLINLGCVIMKRNIDELPEMFKMADELKIDAFVPIPLLPNNTDMTVLKNEKIVDLCPSSDEDIKRIKKAFREITNMKTKHIKTLSI